MFFVKALWFLSLVAATASFLAAHFYLPQMTAITFNADGSGELFMPKSNLFYFGLTGMLLVNLSLLVLGNFSRFLTIPVPKIAYWNSMENKERLVKRFKMWLRGIAVIINFFLVGTSATLYQLNGGTLGYNIAYWFYGLIFFLILWLIFYFPLFNSTKVQEAL